MSTRPSKPLTSSPISVRAPSNALSALAPTSGDGASSRPSQRPPGREHLEDLRRIRKLSVAGARSSLRWWAKRNTPISFVLFIGQTLLSWISTLVLSPATIFSDPVGTAVALVIYPLIWTLLGLVVFVFWIAGLLGGQQIVDYLSLKYAKGYSAVNWPNPQIFGPSSKVAIDDATTFLTGETPTTKVQAVSIDVENPDYTSTKTARLFSLPLARAFLLFSALVYERSDKLVEQAADTAFRASQRYKPDSESYKREMKRAETTLEESVRLIKKQAAAWGLAFDGVSDLATIGGPFASVFYTPFEKAREGQKPFIVLVFKGTGPSNFSEFLVDATIARVGSGVFFGGGSGTVHQGFYTDLFVTNDPGSSGDGYGSIVRTLRHTAERMQREYGGNDLKIPLWVAGHSLGSALASLCYARFLRSPSDLGPILELRDCYSYGTPRLGDGNFASAFEQTLITPLDRPSILWRVANNKDVVTRVPPGLADNESNRAFLPSLSVLNYAFLGPAIRLKPASWPHSLPFYHVEQVGAFHEATEVQVVDHVPRIEGGPAGTTPENWVGWRKRSARWRSVEADEGKNPLRWAMALLPSFLYDHFPASYLQHLNNLETSDETLARQQEEARIRRTTGTPATTLLGTVRKWSRDVSGNETRSKETAMEEMQAAGVEMKTA